MHLYDIYIYIYASNTLKIKTNVIKTTKSDQMFRNKENQYKYVFQPYVAKSLKYSMFKIILNGTKSVKSNKMLPNLKH